MKNKSILSLFHVIGARDRETGDVLYLNKDHGWESKHNDIIFKSFEFANSARFFIDNTIKESNFGLNNREYEIYSLDLIPNELTNSIEDLTNI